MSISLLRRALLLPLLAALAMVAVLLAPPASAHDVLTSSEPADGAQLDSAPESIVLTFNNDLLDSAQAVLVTDADGTTVAEGSPEVNGSTATFPLSALSAGEYAATWSVVSSDGHRIDGELSFTVAAGAATAEPAAPSSAPAPAASPDEMTTPDQATTSAATAPDEQAEDGGSGVPVWLAVLVTVGVAGSVVALVIRRWRGQA